MFDTLYLKSPKALETPIFPQILLFSTVPPADSILFFSFE